MAELVRKDSQKMPQCGIKDGDSVRATEFSLNKRVPVGGKAQSLSQGHLQTSCLGGVKILVKPH